MSAAAVEVLELRRATGAGALRAIAKVRLGCIVISGVRIIQQEGAGAWIALPQVPTRRSADGAGKGWAPVVEVRNREVFDQLRQVLLSAWQEEPLP